MIEAMHELPPRLVPRSGQATLTEAQFSAQVIRLAKLLGYAAYHTHDSRRSAKGFPDLVLVRPAANGQSGRVIFAELKGTRTRVTDEQRAWIRALQEAGAEAYIWRYPRDVPAIERTLR